MTDNDLIAKRNKWLTAAKIYYLSPGDDSGMSDHEWDRLGRELYAAKDEMPWCPVLNHPDYTGGSLFWVTFKMYDSAFAAKPEENV